MPASNAIKANFLHGANAEVVNDGGRAAAWAIRRAAMACGGDRIVLLIPKQSEWLRRSGWPT